MARLSVIETGPPYVPSTIRGGKTSRAIERYQEGMQNYLHRDYAAAATQLRDATRQDSELQPALFYLGISELLLGKPDPAIEALSKLIRMETNPYQEESHWYLAKAFFRKRDLGAAQKELEAVTALNGPHRLEATQALEVVRQLTGPNQ